MSTELEALSKVNFNWTRSLESVWTATDLTVDPNNALADEMVKDLHHATQLATEKPRQKERNPLAPGRNSCDKAESLLATITDTQNDPPEVWCGGCVPGHDSVAGSLAGEAGGDRRGNALFWSPLSLRICLSSP